MSSGVAIAGTSNSGLAGGEYAGLVKDEASLVSHGLAEAVDFELYSRPGRSLPDGELAVDDPAAAEPEPDDRTSDIPRREPTPAGPVPDDGDALAAPAAGLLPTDQASADLPAAGPALPDTSVPPAAVASPDSDLSVRPVSLRPDANAADASAAALAAGTSPLSVAGRLAFPVTAGCSDVDPDLALSAAGGCGALPPGSLTALPLTALPLVAPSWTALSLVVLSLVVLSLAAPFDAEPTGASRPLLSPGTAASSTSRPPRAVSGSAAASASSASVVTGSTRFSTRPPTRLQRHYPHRRYLSPDSRIVTIMTPV